MSEPNESSIPSEFVPYEIWNGGPAPGVVGDLYVLPGVRSPELGNERDVFVHLPRSYATDPARRYPVVYAQDGQNLFDPQRSYAGEWRFDETLETLADEGNEWIVVGVANAGHERIHEYSPVLEPGLSEGRASLYVRFLVETLKPRIDRDLRTIPGPESTAILGSSLRWAVGPLRVLREAADLRVGGRAEPFAATRKRGDSRLPRTPALRRGADLPRRGIRGGSPTAARTVLVPPLRPALSGSGASGFPALGPQGVPRRPGSDPDPGNRRAASRGSVGSATAVRATLPLSGAGQCARDHA